MYSASYALIFGLSLLCLFEFEQVEAQEGMGGMGGRRCPTDGNDRPQRPRFQSIDGTGNNPRDWGAAETELRRDVQPSSAYAQDSFVQINSRINPRIISNIVADQTVSHLPNAKGASSLLFQWGQFLDHDISITHHSSDSGTAAIVVPEDDLDMANGTTIPFTRSTFSDEQNTGARQHPNSITSFIDASNVYGSTAEVAALLRTFSGGKLKTSAGDLLPFKPESSTMFLAGDERVNEQFGLTTMHTLFVREHNWWTDTLAAREPTWNDERLYQEARRMVGAEMQAITYNEFLPMLMGPSFSSDLGDYCYDPDLNPAISTEFSTAAFRIGHTMLPNNLHVLYENGTQVVDGGFPLADIFFTPDKVVEFGIDSILRGLGGSVAQEIDNMLTDNIRNMLFAIPGHNFGLDLAALNIQRGRDHGLPSFNRMRVVLGLPRATPNNHWFLPGLANKLMEAYESTNFDNVELWIGLLTEEHYQGSMVGEVAYRMILDQFQRLMNGDAYFYRGILTDTELETVDGTTLRDIILRNTDIKWMQKNVFDAAPRAF